MKKIVSMFIVLLILVSITSCKSSKIDNLANTSTPTPSELPISTNIVENSTVPTNSDANSINTSAPGSSGTQKQNNTTSNSSNSSNNASSSSSTNNQNNNASNTATYDPITQDNMIPLCYDLVDYMRTQGLGRTFVTSAAERQRMKSLVSSSWSQIDNATKNYLTQMAQEGQKVKNTFTALSNNEKNQLKATWKKTVLSPSLINAPLLNPKTYSQSGISFCYPNDWAAESFNFNEFDWLFTYKIGIPSTIYADICDITKCPAGSLSTIFPNNEGYNATQVADILRNSVTTNAPGMKEINKYDTNLGSSRILNGYFPGQSEEKFIWLVIIPKNDQYIFCRMSGPISQADTLIPAFYNMLNTLNWSTTPAGGGGTGEAYGAFETAWSRVSTSIVKDIWLKD